MPLKSNPLRGGLPAPPSDAPKRAQAAQRRPSKMRRQPTWGEQLLRLEPLWLLLLAPSLLFTEYFWDLRLRPLLILALFLFWPLRLQVGKSVLPAGGTGWLLGFLLLWPPLALWHAGDRVASWEQLGYYYLALVLFVSIIHSRLLQRWPQLIVVGLGLVGLGLAIIGPESFSVSPDKLFDLYATEEIGTQGNGLWAESINPNILAGALTLILPLLLAPLLRWPQGRYGWLVLGLWLPAGVLLNAILVSQSRGALLATAVATLLLCTLRWPRLRYALILSSAVGLLYWLLGAESWLTDQQLALSAGDSFSRRVVIWQYSLALVKSAPLLGIGIGLYEEVFVATYPALILPHGHFIPPHAHNLALQIALDLGLPGLLALIGFAISLLFGFSPLRANRGTGLWAKLGVKPVTKLKWATTDEWILTAGLLGALTAGLIFGLFDNGLWGTKLWFIPMTIAALAYLLGTEKKRDHITHAHQRAARLSNDE